MGVTITSPKHSIDMGYGSFYNLRRRIATDVSQEAGELYKELTEIILSPFTPHEAREEEYNQKQKRLRKVFRGRKDVENIHLVHNFLWASDAGGWRTPKACRAILEVIVDEPDEIKIGYIGWGENCATMGDFKQILQECVESGAMMHWY